MVTGSRVRVVVEIERTAATVSGRTAVGPSAAVEFYGWLELIGQLEGALGQPTSGAPNLRTDSERNPDDICDT
jgi:hypothetical protein